jgi:NADH:ubiquinone oxidoreductase subunit E
MEKAANNSASARAMPYEAANAPQIESIISQYLREELIPIIDQTINRTYTRRPRPALVTMQQAAEMLGISYSKVRNMRERGELASSNGTWIPITEIDRLIDGIPAL